MKKLFTTALAAVVISTAAVVAPVAVSPAAAQQGNWGDAPGAPQDRNHWGGHHKQWPQYYRGNRHHPRHGRVVRRHRDGDAAAAAIIGLATGAVIGGILSESRRNDRVYVAPRDYRAYRGPKVITLDQGSLEPWTASWYRYCDARYRSFNPNTGTFRGYDGQDHFCVAR